MKIRMDFVSNSSSSSYICAVNGTYVFKQLVKDIARRCINKKSEFHDPSLEEANRRTLEWCIDQFQLLFLGALTVGQQEFKYSKKDVEEHAAKLHKDLSRNEVYSIAKKKWDSMLKQMHTENEATPGSAVYDASTETIVFTDKIIASGLAVDTGTLSHLRLRAVKNGQFDEKSWSNVVEQHAKWHEDNIDELPFIDTYSITQQTIDNTRALIAAGKNIKLDGWENLDSIQKRLDLGEKLFAVRICRDGDGKSAYSIYQEDNADGIDSLAVEILHSEAM